jgi:NAD(P)-dependent dehydrogenase (short-subunit alcohol dehydrogenase family)
VDGNELIFGTNYLSHYLLTRLLLPALLARRAPRVVSVGARQMGARFDFDDLDMQRDYKPMQAVLRAKLGLFCLTRELAGRHASQGLRASCLDPGLVDTPYQQGSSWLLRAALRVFGSSPEQVAELYEWLAISGDVSPEGRMYASPGKPVKWHAYVADDANTKRIWEVSAEKVGLEP